MKFVLQDRSNGFYLIADICGACKSDGQQKPCTIRRKLKNNEPIELKDATRFNNVVELLNFASKRGRCFMNQMSPPWEDINVLVVDE